MYTSFSSFLCLIWLFDVVRLSFPEVVSSHTSSWLFEVACLPFPEVVILSCHPPFYPFLLGVSLSAQALPLCSGSNACNWVRFE